MHNARLLSEPDLLEHLHTLVRTDRQNTAQMLAYLSEMDERKLWAKLGYPSMFAMCTERFHMSESIACKRIWAARATQDFPALLTMVRRGEVHLSGIVRLRKHLTEHNAAQVLEQAKHKSVRQIEDLVAALAPKPDAPSRIVPIKSPSTNHGSARARSSSLPTSVPETKRTRAVTPPPRGQVTPLAPQRYKLQVTVDQETRDVLSQLQDLLGHQVPNADPSPIVAQALRELLAATLNKKAAQTDHPRAGRSSGGERSRRIPAQIRREVWQRDGGRCAFVAQDGRRCGATRMLEYHHRQPYGRGGEHRTDNVSLRCRAHNEYHAELDYGPAFMSAKRGGDGVRETVAVYGRRKIPPSGYLGDYPRRQGRATAGKSQT